MTVAVKALLFHDASATQRARQRALTEAAVNQVCVGKCGKLGYRVCSRDSG